MGFNALMGVFRQFFCLFLLLLIGCNWTLPNSRAIQETTATLTETRIPHDFTPVSSPLGVGPIENATSAPRLPSKTPSPTLEAVEFQATTSEQAPVELELISGSNAGRLTQINEMHFGDWEQITALAWSPDNQLLAVSAGVTIYLVDVQEWIIKVALRAGVFNYDIDFSLDGLNLAAGGRDGFLRVWSLPASLTSLIEDPQPVIELLAHKKGVNSVAFSPNGQLLATGGNDAVARIWDLQTGENVGTMIGGTFAVPSIAFAPDGKVLAVVNGKSVRLREVGSERILGTFLAENPLFTVAYSPNGRWLAAGDNANRIMLWDAESAYRTGQERYPKPILLMAHQGTIGSYRALIWRVVFSADGRLLVSAGGDTTVRLWSLADGSFLSLLPGHEKGATCVAFNPNGSGLASGGLDGVLRLWGVYR